MQVTPNHGIFNEMINSKIPFLTNQIACSKQEDWLSLNRDTVSEWGDITIPKTVVSVN
jgi:hypothetical protein